jgi:hypothetical protein
VKIYRCGKNIRAFHNLGEGRLHNTGYEHIFLLIDAKEKLDYQTRIFMTNTVSLHYSAWFDEGRGTPVVYSPIKNRERCNKFFQMATGQNMAENLPERFMYLQKQIASKKTDEDFDRIVTISYYHHVHSQKLTTMPGLVGNKDFIVDVVDPVETFGAVYSSKSINSKPAQDCGNKEYLRRLLHEYKNLKDNSRYWGFHGPVDALLSLLKFELCYLTSSPIAHFPSKYDKMYNDVHDQILRYREWECCDVNVLRYYESALYEICELKEILDECKTTEEYGTSKAIYLPYFITARMARCKRIEHNSKAYIRFCEYIDELMRRKTSFLLKYLVLRMSPFSSGEQALQNIFSWLSLTPSLDIIQGEDTVQIQDNILLLLDEVDLYMHPEWQRNFLHYLSKQFEQEYKGKHIQIIISTHSPLVLSDIPSGNIIYLEKNDEKCTIAQRSDQKESFGANIFSLLKDSFFLKRSLGEFAYFRISEMIKNLEELEKHPENCALRKTCKEYRQVIDIIGEPVLRRKLDMMYVNIFGSNDKDPNELALERVEQLLKRDAIKYRERLMKMLSDVESD